MEIVRKLTIKTCGDWTQRKIQALLASAGPVQMKSKVLVTDGVEQKDAQGNPVRVLDLDAAGKPQPVLDKDGKEVRDPLPLDQSIDLIKISGKASGAATGQTDKGTYTKMQGLFVGVDMTTGAMYQSKFCILPEWVGSILGEAILSNTGPVEFAFMISVRRMAREGGTGYEYLVKPIGGGARVTSDQIELMKMIGVEIAQEPAKIEAAAPAAPVTEVVAGAPGAPAPAAAAAPASSKKK